MNNKKSRILVVDDEPKIRMFIRANLEARGYEVHLAQDGIEAVETAARVLLTEHNNKAKIPIWEDPDEYLKKKEKEANYSSF